MVFIETVKINGFLSFTNFELKLSSKENIIVGTQTNFMKLANYINKIMITNILKLN